MTVAEGGGKRAVQKKFQDIYVPALKANWLVWPTVQVINFRVMPIQYQIVRVAQSTLLPSLTVFPAFRVHRRYCLDGIPFPHELRRGSDNNKLSRINHTRLSLYILGPSAFQVALDYGLVLWITLWISCAARSCIPGLAVGVQALKALSQLTSSRKSKFDTVYIPSLGFAGILSLSFQQVQ
jgi:hypothetical protein